MKQRMDAALRGSSASLTGKVGRGIGCCSGIKPLVVSRGGILRKIENQEVAL